MKILYFTNIPAPYKIDFLNILSKESTIHCVFNTINNEKRDKRWYLNNKCNFKTIKIGIFGFIKLIKLIKNESYDFIINDNYASLSGAIISVFHPKKSKYFINAEGGFVNKNENFISKFLKTFFLSRADYVFSSGNETNKYLIYYGVKRNNILLYPFSSLYEEDLLNAPIPYSKKLELRKESGYDYNRLYISIGRFIKSKAYNEFLKNVAINYINENIGFLIIGSGEEKQNYLRTIKNNGINNVHLIDFCDKKEIFRYLQMCDVFFFPSFSDTWGLVINEAMANGLPVISSNKVIAASELIEKKYLYDSSNFDELSKLIFLFNEDSEDTLFNIGKENIKKIGPYTIQNMANKYMSYLKRFINNE